MISSIIRFPLAVVEGMHLAGLIDEFTALLAAADDADPGIERLTPSAYPEDAEASAEFAAATRDDLRERRAADAAAVRHALAPFLAEAAKDLAEDDVLAPRDVIIQAGQLDAWLRTLTALRLVIASRLDISDDDDDRDPEDPRFGVYDWLGFRLDGLIEIADALDDAAEAADGS